MKYLLFLSLILASANADYLNTKTTNQCIFNVKPYQNNTGLCYTKRSNNQSFCSSTLRYKYLIDGYEYKNAICSLKNDLEITGLSQNEFNYLLAFLAHAMGFTMLILINYTAVLISKN